MIGFKLFSAVAVLSLIVFGFTNCSGKDSSVIDSNTRSYYMGFTTWPYSATDQGMLFPYTKIATEADMITLHIEGGVPWADAESDQLLESFSSHYNTHLVADWTFRKSNIPTGHKIYLALNSIDAMREGIAKSWTAAGNEQNVYPWSPVPSFNDQRVKTAYLNYCKRAITYFNPDFFAFGIEVNLLFSKNPGQWQDFLEFHQYIYENLKTTFPQLPIFITQTAQNLLPGFNPDLTTSTEAFNSLMQYSDFFAISIYPYLSSYLANPLPDNLFDNLRAMSNKPIVISEGGYPAQAFSLSNGVQIDGDPTKQSEFVNALLNSADKYEYKFVNLWLVRDFDDSWGTSDFVKLFKNIGMYDLSGNPRPARDVWMSRLAKEKR